MTRSLQSVARWTAIIATPVFLLIAADVYFHGALFQYDPEISRSIYTHLTATQATINMVRTAGLLTQLGHTPVTATIAILISLGLLVAQRKRLLVFWLIAVLGEVVLINSLKWFYARPRPTIYAFFRPEGGYSFPSGHTMGAVVIYFMLAYVFYRLNNNPQVGKFFLTIAIAVTLLVSASLLMIGVHYFTDVLGALALGLAWVGIVVTVAERQIETARPAHKSSRARSAPQKKRRAAR
jgi:undecaprenyl-diphosphatase